MQERQDRQIIQSASSIRRQLGQLYLLVGGTALLLAWLSVGLSPSTWWLLIQIIRQINVLWARQGASILGMLLLLVIQSLLLLSAWIVLIWVALRESSRLYALLPGIAKPIPVTPVAVTAPQPMQDSPMPVRPDLPVTASPVQSSLIEQPAGVQSQHFRKTQMAPLKGTAQMPQITHVSEVPTQYNVSPAFDVPGPQNEAVMFPVQDHMQQVKIDEAVVNNPFTVHENVMEAFLQENPLKKAEGSLEQMRLADEPEQKFVFGDPFEGPLPDVFEHDADLKRSVDQQGIKPRPGH